MKEFNVGEFGMHKVYCPHTNKCVGKVMMGYVYVAALEQKAQNKIYSVNLGRSHKNKLYNQPISGKQQHGSSVKVGTMELSNYISYGLPHVI